MVQIRVTPKTRNPFTLKALSISDVTWKWHFLNHAGIISLISALILYFATEDFIKNMTEQHLSTLRGMAAAAVGIGLSKFVVMLPSRAVKTITI